MRPYAIYLSIPLLYLTVVAVAYLRYGFIFQYMLGLVAVLVIPVVAYFAKSKEFLKTTLFFVTVLLTYEALQGITGSMVSTNSVISLAGLDKALFGVDLDSVFQAAFTSAAVTAVSTVFYGLHVVLVIVAVVLFWFTNRTVYKGYVYAMTLTSYLALMTFVVFPTGPPWFEGAARNLLTAGYKLMPSAFGSLQNALLSVESDKFAAFPSLHAAYATLFTVYAFKLNTKVGLLTVPILAGVLFAIIYLGQHYVVDIIGGVTYSLGSVFVVDKLNAMRTTKARAVPAQ